MNRSKALRDWGIAVLRVAVGGVFVAHGAQKLFVYGIPGVAGLMAQLGIPFPTLSALAVTAAEFLGGLALLAGFFTRLAALPIAFSMVVAAATVHLKNGFFLPNGAEYVLLLLSASAALSLTGSGAFSVDRLLAGRRARAAAGTLPPARRLEMALQD
ncbi:MAG: DoxX family protein [Planctomycetes bacterium]|nr:DoxX family protein [Planctomycetota bacterium]